MELFLIINFNCDINHCCDNNHQHESFDVNQALEFSHQLGILRFNIRFNIKFTIFTCCHLDQQTINYQFAYETNLLNINTIIEEDEENAEIGDESIVNESINGINESDDSHIMDTFEHDTVFDSYSNMELDD